MEVKLVCLCAAWLIKLSTEMLHMLPLLSASRKSDKMLAYAFNMLAARLQVRNCTSGASGSLARVAREPVARLLSLALGLSTS